MPCFRLSSFKSGYVRKGGRITMRTVSGSFCLRSLYIIGKAHSKGTNGLRNVSLLTQMGNSMTLSHWMRWDCIVVARKRISASKWATLWRPLTGTILTWASWVPCRSLQTLTTKWKRIPKSVGIQAIFSMRVTTAIWFTPLAKSVHTSIPSAIAYFRQPYLFLKELQPD